MLRMLHALHAHLPGLKYHSVFHDIWYVYTEMHLYAIFLTIFL